MRVELVAQHPRLVSGQRPECTLQQIDRQIWQGNTPGMARSRTAAAHQVDSKFPAKPALSIRSAAAHPKADFVHLRFLDGMMTARCG